MTTDLCVKWEWDAPTVPMCWGGPAPMGAGSDYLRGPNWFSLHTVAGGHAFVLTSAAAASGAVPSMHFGFANFFGTVWSFAPAGMAGTHQMAGNLTLTRLSDGCAITWPSRVTFEQDMAWDYMKNTVDEVIQPAGNVLHWSQRYAPLPWGKFESCDFGSIIWTDAPRPRPIYQRNTQAGPRPTPMSWAFEF